jgi:LCP family protein required for cell wall assembly
VAIALLGSIGTFAYIKYRAGQIKTVPVNSLTTQANGAALTQPVDILLIGNNSRAVLNGKQAAAFGTGSEVAGARSDVAMILRLDPMNGTAAVLSLPRDLWTPVPGSKAEYRIDDNLNSSPAELVSAVQQDLGIPINHFVELNFDTFQSVVNALGGLNMYFPDPLKDAYSGLDITSTGCIHLNGTQALQVVRARHLYYYADGYWHADGTGDLGRIRRDHEFLVVLAKKVLANGFANPATDNAIVGAVAPDLTVDQGMTLSYMLALARRFRHINPTSVPTSTLPVYLANSYNYYAPSPGYSTNYIGDVVMPTYPQDLNTIDQFLGRTQLPGMSVSPGSFQLQVIPAGGIGFSYASQAAQGLVADGFNATAADTPSSTLGSGADSGSATNGTYTLSVVRYAPGSEKQAERVLDDISGEVSMGMDPSLPKGAVQLVAGNEISIAPPGTVSAASSTGQTSSSSTTNQATTGSSASASGSTPASAGSAGSTTPAAVTAPAAPTLNDDTVAATSPTQAYSPWNPRGCTASGGPAPVG